MQGRQGKQSSSAAFIRETARAMFSRAAVLISETKQTGPCLWPPHKGHFVLSPPCASVAANVEFKATEMKG